MILTCHLNGQFAWAMLVDADALAPLADGPFTYTLTRRS
jgi:hypothetical protein